MKVCAYVKHDGLECLYTRATSFWAKNHFERMKCNFKVFVPLIKSFITEQ